MNLEKEINDLEKARREHVENQIGSAARGIDEARRYVKGFLDADRGFFRQGGVGDEFYRALQSASPEVIRQDSEYQEKLARGTAEGRGRLEREKEAEREFERSEIEGPKRSGEALSKSLRETRKSDRQAEDEALDTLGDEATKSGRTLSKALGERRLDHAEEGNRLARLVDQAIKRDKRLDLAVNRAVAQNSYETPEQIADALSGNMERLLTNNNGIPEFLRGDVGRAVLLNRAMQVQGAIGASGEAGVMGQLDDQGARLDRADRLAYQRRADEADRAALMQQFADHGANAQQAQAMSNRAVNLIHMGLGFDRAMAVLAGNATAARDARRRILPAPERSLPDPGQRQPRPFRRPTGQEPLGPNGVPDVKSGGAEPTSPRPPEVSMGRHPHRCQGIL